MAGRQNVDAADGAWTSVFGSCFHHAESVRPRSFAGTSHHDASTGAGIS